jgi:hypothetical protein
MPHEDLHYVELLQSLYPRYQHLVTVKFRDPKADIFDRVIFRWFRQVEDLPSMFCLCEDISY